MKEIINSLKFILGADIKKWFLLQSLLGVGAIIFQISVSALVGYVFLFIEEKDFIILYRTLIIINIGFVIAAISRYFATKHVKIVTNNSIMNFRQSLLEASLNKLNNEKLMVYFNEDMNSIDTFLNKNSSDIIIGLVVGIVSLLIMSIANIWFSVVMFICVLLAILNQMNYFKKLNDINTNIRKSKSNVYANLIVVQ